MKALVLDFDGVISDSAPECLVVALRTYAELRPGSGLDRHIEELRGETGYSLDRIYAHALFQRFLDLMPLGNRAEDFGVALSIIERDAVVRDQADYDRERNAQSNDFLDEFHRRFYQIRDSFSHSDPAGWRRLLGPYSVFLSLLRRWAYRTTLAIATAKDRRSVILLLRDYGIADLFTEDRVLDKETGVSKVAHLKHLQQRLDLPFASMTFMDDKVNHLDTVAPLGVRCALATWGYNGIREHRLARERGYRICSLENVESELLG